MNSLTMRFRKLPSGGRINEPSPTRALTDAQQSAADIKGLLDARPIEQANAVESALNLMFAFIREDIADGMTADEALTAAEKRIPQIVGRKN